MWKSRKLGLTGAKLCWAVRLDKHMLEGTREVTVALEGGMGGVSCSQGHEVPAKAALLFLGWMASCRAGRAPGPKAVATEGKATVTEHSRCSTRRSFLVLGLLDFSHSSFYASFYVLKPDTSPTYHFLATFQPLISGESDKILGLYRLTGLLLGCVPSPGGIRNNL